MGDDPRGDSGDLAPARHVAGPSADRLEPELLVSTVRLNELIRTLRRHLWLVLGVAAGAVAATGYVAYRVGPVYRAVAVIRLADSRRALTGGVVEDPGDGGAGRFADPLLSQVQLLTSRTVAGSVVDSMPMLRVETRNVPASLLADVAVADTAEADTFDLAFGRDSLVVRARSVERRTTYGTAMEVGGIRFAVLKGAHTRRGLLRVDSREVAITRLIAHLRVTSRARTDIVDVAYSAPDPQRAEQVVNHVVDVFRSTSAEAAQRQSRLRREFLEGQLKINDSLLADARDALTAFHRRARAYRSGESLAPELTGLPAGLDLEREQLDAERRRYEGLLVSLRDSSASRKPVQTALSVPGVAANPAVTQLNAQLFQYETERDSLASRAPKHPDLPRLNLLISSTEAKLLRAVQAGVQSSIASLDGRIAAMNDVRARHQRLSATEAEEARLTERVENARKVADELRIEYQKAGIAEAVTVGQVEIVDHAIVPTKPIGFGLAEQLALGLLVGLVLGAGGALVAERLSSSIAGRVQVEQLGMSVLGIVPHFNRDGAKKAAKHTDALVEAFRGIRLGVMNAYGAAGPVVVAVTSPGIGDGKSFVSSNMALAFAHANHRTLLVDADLRRGGLNRVLQLRRMPGLTDFLAGEASLEQIVQSTTHPSLDVVASGSRRRDAPELLGSARMVDLVTDLRSRYGVIVLDTPPLGAGVDAFTLTTLAGSLLMVLRLGRTERELAEVNLELLRRHPVRLLGAVLNDVRDGSEYRYYGYYLEGYDQAAEPLFHPLVASRPESRPHVPARGS